MSLSSLNNFTGCSARKILPCCSFVQIDTRTMFHPMKRYQPAPGKPSYKPPAKLRRYAVKQHPKFPYQDPSIIKELLWRRKAYNTAILSLRYHFREELRKAGGGTELEAKVAEMKQREEEEFKEILKWNDEKNKIALRQTKAKQVEEEMRMEADAQEKLGLFKRIEERKMDELYAELYHKKEMTRNMITEENLMSRLDEAIENPINFNSVIDIHGNQYIHKTKIPPISRQLSRSKRFLYSNEMLLPLEPKYPDHYVIVEGNREIKLEHKIDIDSMLKPPSLGAGSDEMMDEEDQK